MSLQHKSIPIPAISLNSLSIATFIFLVYQFTILLHLSTIFFVIDFISVARLQIIIGRRQILLQFMTSSRILNPSLKRIVYHTSVYISGYPLAKVNYMSVFLSFPSPDLFGHYAGI